MKQGRRYNLGTVSTVAVLVGLVGFSLGFNYPRLRASFFANRSDLPNDLPAAELESVYDSLRERFAGSLDINQLLEGAKRGLVEAAGDPYTVYLDAAEAAELQSALDGVFSGIGAEIAIKNDRLVIVAPLEGSPAQGAGLLAGDHILSINGEDSEGMSADTAVAKIRGEAGSEVKLLIERADQPTKEYVIKRAVIEVPAVKSQLIDGGIGYIELSRFGKEADEELVKAATELKAQGASKFILDLRNNPGGLLDVAVAIADEFLPVGKTIVDERKDEEVLATFRSTSGGSLEGVPLVVLINEGSASASEIIAGAIKDNSAGTLIGTKSFGKGSVQELVTLEGKAYLKVTIARWYTPTGRNISQEGIEPDQNVELSSTDFNLNRDPQLEAAVAKLR